MPAFKVALNNKNPKKKPSSLNIRTPYDHIAKVEARFVFAQLKPRVSMKMNFKNFAPYVLLMAASADAHPLSFFWNGLASWVGCRSHF